MSLEVGLMITTEKERGKNDEGHKLGQVLFPGLSRANAAILT